MSIVEDVARDLVTEEEVSALLHKDDTDAELLQGFVSHKNQSAFAQLVARHAGLVMGVCRRTLGKEQDAEDAFQATFLVLARKAASVRQAASLSAWLYLTAYRIALRARAGLARRKEQSLEAETMIAAESLSQIANEHEHSILDEEFHRLPEKYRLPLFLCCLEDKTREEAAEQLGLSEGALKGRLERGRNLLRRRLLSRGVSFGLGFGIWLGWQEAVMAAQLVPSTLLASTVEAGANYAACQSPAEFVSEKALSLANGSTQMASLTTIKTLACGLLFFGAIALVSHQLPAPALAGGEGDSLNATLELANSPSEAVAVLLPNQEAGPRRSPEGEAGPRRSPEGERGPRDDAEGERGPRDDAEGEGASRQPDALRGFKPANKREAELYKIILQLQKEVDFLKRNQARRPSDQPNDRPRAKSKAESVFRAFDKNQDNAVTLEEWLTMTNGNVNAARRKLQTKRFQETQPGSDNQLSLDEFSKWWNSLQDGKATLRNREPGRSAEGEAGPRRSPEAEAGPRRSSEN